MEVVQIDSLGDRGKTALTGNPEASVSGSLRGVGTRSRAGLMGVCPLPKQWGRNISVRPFM